MQSKLSKHVNRIKKEPDYAVINYWKYCGFMNIEPYHPLSVKVQSRDEPTLIPSEMNMCPAKIIVAEFRITMNQYSFSYTPSLHVTFIVAQPWDNE